jgi:hypothetical protein
MLQNKTANKDFNIDNLFVTFLAEQENRQPAVAGQGCELNQC